MNRLMAWNVLAVMAALCFAFGAQSESAFAAPAAEAFLMRQPGLIAVSPSGHYIAWITSKGPEESALTVASFDNGQVGPLKVSSAGKTAIIDVAFKSDDIILLTVLQKNVRLTDVQFEHPEDAKISRAVVIAVPRAGGTPVALKPTMAQSVIVKEALNSDPDHVLLEGYEGKITETRIYMVSSLYKVNVHTGEAEVAESAVGREVGTSRDRRFVQTVGWEVASNGVAYLRYDLEGDRNLMSVMSRVEGGSWTRIARYPLIDGAPQIEFRGLASPTTAYAVDRAGADKRAVWEYDLTTGQPLRQIMADPNGEATDIAIDHYRGTLLGATFIRNGVPKPPGSRRRLGAGRARSVVWRISDQPHHRLLSGLRRLRGGFGRALAAARPDAVRCPNHVGGGGQRRLSARPFRNVAGQHDYLSLKRRTSDPRLSHCTPQRRQGRAGRGPAAWWA